MLEGFLDDIEDSDFNTSKFSLVDNLCGEIYVTKYVYVDSEEYLNLFKYDCFLYVIILQIDLFGIYQ